MISKHITRPLQSEVQRITRENLERHLSPAAAPRYAKVLCSQCGGEFGPGDHGFSHCESHVGKLDHSRVDAAMAALKMVDGYQARSNRRALELQIAAAGMTA